MATTQSKTRTLAQIKRQLAEKRKKALQNAAANSLQTEFVQQNTALKSEHNGATADFQCALTVPGADDDRKNVAKSNDLSSLMATNNFPIGCLPLEQSTGLMTALGNACETKRAYEPQWTEGRHTPLSLNDTALELQFDEQLATHHRAKKPKTGNFVDLQLVVDELKESLKPADRQPTLLAFEDVSASAEHQTPPGAEILLTKQQKRGRRPLATKAALAVTKNQQTCNCRRQAMVKCRSCGALCHEDCISPDHMCFLCLSAGSVR